MRFVSSFAALALVATIAVAASAEDIDKVAAQIDQDTASAPNDTRSASLSEQFAVPESKIDAMRADKKGWGAISTELALAQELAKKDPATYPTTEDALKKIEALRAEKKGYGVIAKDLGMKVGPIVSAVHRNEHSIKHPDHPGKASESARPEKPAKPARPEKPAKADRPEHGGKNR
jgi:hypothetical protein